MIVLVIISQINGVTKAKRNRHIRKIEVVTKGLHKYIDRELTEEVSTENAITIANFILAQKTEINLADTYRKTFINVLTILSKFLKNNYSKI